MKYSGDLETIKDFALKDRDNLSSFLRICSCFDEVKTHLRNEFIGILKIFLRRELEGRGWVLKDQMSDKWDQSYPKLHIYKENFPLSGYHVAMESTSRVARQMVYGIRNGDDPQKSPQQPNNDIWTILNDKVQIGGKPGQWYSWYKYLEQPYLDWNDPDALIQMFESIGLSNKPKENTSMVEKIGNKLVGAAFALDFWFENRKD